MGHRKVNRVWFDDEMIFMKRLSKIIEEEILKWPIPAITRLGPVSVTNPKFPDVKTASYEMKYSQMTPKFLQIHFWPNDVSY